MKFIAAAIAVSALCALTLSAAEHISGDCQHQPCIAHECMKVHDTKITKKVVYEVKCVPVCEHRPAKFLHCDCCPVCELKYKRVLVKREVVSEVCTTKCVPVEVPCNCCKE